MLFYIVGNLGIDILTNVFTVCNLVTYHRRTDIEKRSFNDVHSIVKFLLHLIHINIIAGIYYYSILGDDVLPPKPTLKDKHIVSTDNQ